jgi:hypothetical protein
MFLVLLCSASISSLAIIVTAQKDNKSWLELPRKEAEKLLVDSPWSHTQVDTDASEMFYSPTRQGAATPGRSNGNVTGQQSVNNNRADRGAVNQAVSVTYRICFLSARPIRQAFAKMILSAQSTADAKEKEDLRNRLQGFIDDPKFDSFIVIAVNVESSDPRFSGPIMQLINSATAGTLKNSAYLEKQDGKRLFLTNYVPPIPDGLGAKFIFPRLVDGQPFLDEKSDTVRFVAEFSDSFKLNMRYKVADMILDKRLEY